MCVFPARPLARPAILFFFIAAARRKAKPLLLVVGLSSITPAGATSVFAYVNGRCRPARACARKRPPINLSRVSFSNYHSATARFHPTVTKFDLLHVFVFGPDGVTESTRTTVPGINITPVKVRAFDGEISSSTRGT